MKAGDFSLQAGDVEQTLLVCAHVLLGLMILTSMTVTFKHRNVFPLRERNMPLLMVSGASFFVVCMGQYIRVRNLPCFIYICFNYVGVCITIYCYLARAWLLLFRHKVNLDIVQYRTSREIGWFILHPQRRRCVLTVGAIVLGVCLITPLTVGAAMATGVFSGFCGKVIKEGEPDDDMDLVIMLCSLIEFTAFAVAMVMAYKLKAYERDRCGLKAELVTVFSAALVTLSILILLRVVGTGDFFFAYSVNEWMTCAVYTIITYCTLVHPVRIARRDILIPDTTLTKFLENPRNFERFFQFLTLEFSTENLLFWQRVKKLHECDTESGRQTMHEEIMDQYIDITGPFAINISAETRATIEASERSSLLTTTKVFDEANTEVYTLMATDSFPRFLQSAAYDISTSQSTDVELVAYNSKSHKLVIAKI